MSGREDRARGPAGEGRPSLAAGLGIADPAAALVDALVECTSDVVWLLDPALVVRYVSPRIRESRGYSPDELIGRGALEFIVPGEETELVRLRDALVGTRGDPGSVTAVGRAYTALLRAKDGSPVEGRVTAWILRDGQGTFAGLLALVNDTTEQARAQAARRESEARYRRLFEAANDAIFLMDGERFVDCNERTLELFGCTRDEIVGRAPYEFSPPVQPDGRESPTAARERVDAAFRGEPQRFAWQHRRRDGRCFDAEVGLSLLALDDASYVLAIVRDVTRQNELERQLVQSQRLQALGTLAGGIAHDFNNILAGIQGYTELGLLKLRDGDPGHAELGEVHRAALRAGELVQQILAFSRTKDDEQQPIAIRPIVNEALKLLRASLPATITVQTDISPQVGLVVASPSRLHQLVLNLCTNAFQAMEATGGRLRVALEAVELDAAAVAGRPPLTPGPHVRLVVQDTGVGMDAETLRRCFDPFFTTKEVGRGTGLGLSVVHGIVAGLGGHVSVETAPGQGSAFTVLLPAAVRMAVAAAPLPGVATRGVGRVLVVDDEPAVAALETRMLSWLGYDVTTFTRSAEALAAFEAAPDRFDVVVSDQTMPELTGDRLVERLRARRPSVPVVLCTGFRDAVDPDVLQRLGIHVVLSKPFTQSTLAEAVRDALAHGRR